MRETRHTREDGLRRALVTGATSGIGRALARALAPRGYAVTCVSRRREALEQCIADLPGSGHVALDADLSTSDGIARVAEHLTHEKHDLLVNNAGSTIYGPVHEVPPDEQLRMVTLNVHAIVTLSHAFLCQARAGDSLVNVASVVGMTSQPGAAAYAGSKAFVIRFSESLWYEQRDRRVYVVAFCPGATETNFHRAAGATRSSFPKSMVQSAEQVAAEILSALRARRHPVVVSGAKNRALMFACRFSGRRRIIETVGAHRPKRPGRPVADVTDGA